METFSASADYVEQSEINHGVDVVYRPTITPNTTTNHSDNQANRQWPGFLHHRVAYRVIQQEAQLSLRDRATRCQLKSGKILHRCSTDCT